MSTSGVLYVVATPIGNLADMSPRAVQVLARVDLIAAEDTRHTRPLLAHFNITTPLVAVHEHNERQRVVELLDQIQCGKKLALVSDAGTPLINDPGYVLVRETLARGLKVSPVPGPNAAICALSAGGLPTDRFVFEGFLPRTQGLRRSRLMELEWDPRTLVFYESSHRLKATIADMISILGGARSAVLARELTKLHETLISADLETLAQRLASDEQQLKGEMVLLVAGAQSSDRRREAEARRVLRMLLAELPVKKAAALAANITGVKKNQLYRQALGWRKEN